MCLWLGKISREDYYKMKLRRKIVAIGLSVVMLASVGMSMPSNGYLVDEVHAENSSLEDFTINSSGYLTAYTGTAETVVIPDGVKEISYRAFYGCTTVKKVIIPEGVTSIGIYAFQGCTNLETVTFPSTLRYISDHAFRWCSALKEVVLYEGLTKINEGVFYDCSSLEKVVLPESVTEIESTAFYNCVKLEETNLPKKLVTIGGSAYSGCTALENITVPSTVTGIGGLAFKGTKWLENEKAKSSMVVINQMLIDGTAVTDSDVTIPAGVKEIVGSAFSSNKNIKSVIIPNTVSTVGSLAFSNCTNLESIQFPANIKNIGTSVLYKTKWMENRTYTDGFLIDNGILFGVENSQEELTIPDGVKIIADGIATSNRNFTKVMIPDSVETISSRAFWNGSSTRYVKALVGNKPVIGDYCKISGIQYIVKGSIFEENLDLLKVLLKQGADSNKDYDVSKSELEALSSLVFEDNISLDGLEYAVNLKSLCINDQYGKWTNLQSIYDCGFKKLETLRIQSNGLTDASGLEKLSGLKHLVFQECTALTDVSGVAALTGLESISFAECGALKSVKLPEGLKTIDKYGFAYCSGLTELNIPDSVTRIGIGAFEGCTGFTSLEIPSGVTRIPYSAFWNCKNLKTLTLPSTIEYIDEDAFLKCSSLDIMAAIKPCTNLVGLYLSETSVKDITGIGAFTKLKELSLYKIPAKDITVLKNCTQLENLNLNYTQISDISSLSACTKLKKLEIQSNDVTNLDVLKNMPSLEVLNAAYNEITDLTPLQNCKKLEEVKLDGNDITNVDTLFVLPNLSYAGLTGNQIAKVSSVAQLKEADVKVITIADNPFTEVDMQQNLFLYDEEVEIVAGLTKQLTLANKITEETLKQLMPDDADVTSSSVDADIASIAYDSDSGNCEITANKAGKTSVTIGWGDVVRTINVTVVDKINNVETEYTKLPKLEVSGKYGIVLRAKDDTLWSVENGAESKIGQVNATDKECSIQFLEGTYANYAKEVNLIALDTSGNLKRRMAGTEETLATGVKTFAIPNMTPGEDENQAYLYANAKGEVYQGEQKILLKDTRDGIVKDMYYNERWTPLYWYLTEEGHYSQGSYQSETCAGNVAQVMIPQNALYNFWIRNDGRTQGSGTIYEGVFLDYYSGSVYDEALGYHVNTLYVKNPEKGWCIYDKDTDEMTAIDANGVEGRFILEKDGELYLKNQLILDGVDSYMAYSPEDGSDTEMLYLLRKDGTLWKVKMWGGNYTPQKISDLETVMTMYEEDIKSEEEPTLEPAASQEPEVGASKEPAASQEPEESPSASESAKESANPQVSELPIQSENVESQEPEESPEAEASQEPEVGASQNPVESQEPEDSPSASESAKESANPQTSKNPQESTSPQASVTPLEAPKGKIEIGKSWWETLLEVITFGVYEADGQTVTITSECETDKIEYYVHEYEAEEVSASGLTVEQLAKQEFIPYDADDKPVLKADKKVVVYAKITGEDGQVTYLSSDGLIVSQGEENPGETPDGIKFTLGDVDNNGQIELRDAQLALRMALLLVENLTEEQNKAADVDESGTVELKDAQQILRRALLLIDEFEKVEKE